MTDLFKPRTDLDTVLNWSARGEQGYRSLSHNGGPDSSAAYSEWRKFQPTVSGAATAQVLSLIHI